MRESQTEKVTRFGIRKYSFGAASVAIAAGLLFLGNGAVQADQLTAADSAADPASQLVLEQEVPESGAAALPSSNQAAETSTAADAGQPALAEKGPAELGNQPAEQPSAAERAETAQTVSADASPAVSQPAAPAVPRVQAAADSQPEPARAPETEQPSAEAAKKPQGKLSIENNNPQTGEFDIVVSEIVAPDGLQTVYLPTWSSKDDQDDVQWYRAEKRADGTYFQHVSHRNHKNSLGEYQVHLYYVNDAGQLQGISSAKTQVSKAQPQGKISIENNNPQTGEFDIVVSEIVAPDGLRTVYLPTWSSKDDQDDVQWYRAEKRADGTYFQHVSHRNHKNSLGEYQVHLYYVNDAGQLQGISSAKTQVSKAQPQGKISIENNNPQTGEFDIVVSEIVAPDGLQTVYLPTWSSKDDQDDVQWYRAEKRADGTYFQHVSHRNHKNSLGEYQVHLYYVNDAGQLQGISSAKTQVSKAQPQGKISIENNNPQTGEFDIVVSEIVAPDGLQTVYLPTWSSKDDQDDVQWYRAEKRADGTYFQHVSHRNHKNSLGEYQVHLYYVNDAGQLQGISSAKTQVSKAQPQGKISIENNNPQTGEFDIVVSEIVAPDGLQTVYLPTWSSKDDQDDVQWYRAEKRADGTYFQHVSHRNHKNSLGEYQVHLYYVNDAGQLQGISSAKTQVSKAQPQGKISIENNNPQTGEFDIVVSEIVAPDGLQTVYLPTWSSKDDQDDVQWYRAEKRADGTYFQHVSAYDHRFSTGEYQIHLYYLNADGQLQGVSSGKTVVTVAAENVRATGKITIQNNNARTGSFDVVVTNVSNPKGIQAVYLPTWSADKGQDDIRWYQASKQKDGSYKITVKASDHKLSTGEYLIHLYYQQDDGRMVVVAGTSTQVAKAGYNTPYYSQRDGRWGGRMYGGYNLDATGCVPTTLAMVISGISGQEVLPTAVADYLYNHTNEFNKGGYGTSSRGIVRAAQHWGLKTETLLTAAAVKDVLAQGHHVLGAVGTSVFANYPVTHELVLKGYDNGKTYVRDPYNAANNGWYAVDYLFMVKSLDPTDNTEGSPFIAVKE
ncbi:N-acetylmuramidase [Streptococcus panodentis]|uniref:N-acetylmuramidase n=2 Tax=Streptococcus panodentis TaxID=1581472 RepID=A0ABS5AVG8_9STRE|nr:GBS Bsp-like repeat-containing protein [Streptococcus panodentis]MBP2620566.1 N-acetylmuramidase [Streptococcus panodentis]